MFLGISPFLWHLQTFVASFNQFWLETNMLWVETNMLWVETSMLWVETNMFLPFYEARVLGPGPGPLEAEGRLLSQICREGQLMHLFFPGRVGRGYGPDWTLAVVVVSPALRGPGPGPSSGPGPARGPHRKREAYWFGPKA